MAKDLERYGVFALIFVVMLIVGISIWGPRRERDARAAEPSGDLQRTAGPYAGDLGAGRSGPANTGEGRLAPDFREPRPMREGDDWVEGIQGFYKVVPGDNPTRIAGKLFGDGDRYHPALMEANPDRNALRLMEGMILRVPRVGVPPDSRFLIAEQDLPAPPRPPRLVGNARGGVDSSAAVPPYHIVRHGEPLEKIAKRYYGRRAAVRDIVAANPQIKDPDKIYAGMKLRLP